MSHKSEYTMSAQELIQEVLRLRALEKQFTKERGEQNAELIELRERVKGAVVGAQDARTQIASMERGGIKRDEELERLRERLRAYETPEETEPILKLTRENADLRAQLASADSNLRALESSLSQSQQETTAAEARLAAVLGALDASRKVRDFVKSNEYPAMFSPKWIELTQLLDAQDTQIRRYDAARTGDAIRAQ